MIFIVNHQISLILESQMPPTQHCPRKAHKKARPHRRGWIFRSQHASWRSFLGASIHLHNRFFWSQPTSWRPFLGASIHLDNRFLELAYILTIVLGTVWGHDSFEFIWVCGAVFWPSNKKLDSRFYNSTTSWGYYTWDKLEIIRHIEKSWGIINGKK